MNCKPSSSFTKSMVGVVAGAVMLASAIAPAGAQSRAHRVEATRLASLYAHATPGSPAQFRIHEELEKLTVSNDSPAAFRLAEMQSR
ncbi:MAG TPA: hypothetical protein VK461_00395 [Acidimicrobiales bacterium]|nr:hypothetical protein [Acidimicrobiales bacterium]